MTVGLIVSHAGEKCGVWQFGRNLAEILGKNTEVKWYYAECPQFEHFVEAVKQADPDMVIFNHHPATLPWLGGWHPGSIHFQIPSFLASSRFVSFKLQHMVDQTVADTVEKSFYDYIIALDPTVVPRQPHVVKAPRFLAAESVAPAPDPEVFTVGSFGFATHNKGFHNLCNIVNTQFDRAIIKLNLPMHDDPGTVSMATIQPVIDRCRAVITKPGIELVVSHHWFDNPGIVDWLSKNTINAFLYEDTPGSGISSCTDFALAANKPIALAKTNMFNNFSNMNPSIFVEDRTLAEIAANGASVFDEMRKEASPVNASIVWNKMLLDCLESELRIRSTPDNRGFNKILDDRSRQAYTTSLQDLYTYAPDIIAKKFPRANIQQAYALDTALRFLKGKGNAKILAAGSFEDTTISVLKAKGYRIDEVDPNVNGQTLQEYYAKGSAPLASYDVILSVSVLEHVADDEQFVRIIGEFLKPEGVAILTVDHAEGYNPSMPIPDSDYRMYTTNDIINRLMPLVPDCKLVDTPTWQQGAEDFELGEYRYGFSGIVFRKADYQTAALANVRPVWRDMLSNSQILDPTAPDHRCV
jgi:SAM-dependent methyltransferase